MQNDIPCKTQNDRSNMQIHNDTPNVYHLQGKTRKRKEVQAIHKAP